MLTALLRRPQSGPLLITALHTTALLLFIHGFLLTRVRLDECSAPAGPEQALHAAPRTKLVWILIDSMRYDFLVSDGRYPCPPEGLCHQGHLAYLTNLTSQAQGALAFRFVADAPTTTTQRLKSLMTGGLPSFFDVSSSFTAGQVSEDNLVDQLVAAGKKLAFVGDATWGQLFPSQFEAAAISFPCFNVKDLHTVDDGVWEHLPGMMAAPASWDILVAHYLGVDHAGHAHGVRSAEMVAKLRQMDDHIKQVVETMVQGAGPGGEFERALLLVSGDHGQTLSGDHGGGSPEEVDSALVAIDPAALHGLWHTGSASVMSGASSSGGSVRHGGSTATAGSGSQEGPEAALLAEAASPGKAHSSQGPDHQALGAPAACRQDCSCGPDRNQCASDLLQLDFTATLAALLGVPIPFGNVGKVSAELWGFGAGAAQPPSGSGGEGNGEEGGVAGTRSWGAAEEGLAAALRANVEQVHAYLNKYASTPGASFAASALRGINKAYTDLSHHHSSTHADITAQSMRYLAFLDHAAAVAREQWTQFGDLSMLGGLVLFAATLGLHATAAFGRQQGPSATSISSHPGPNGTMACSALEMLVGMGLLWRPAPGSWPLPTVSAALAAMAAVHALGIFSFFFLLSEGSKVCYVLGAMFTLLTVATCAQPWWAAHQHPGRPNGKHAMGQPASCLPSPLSADSKPLLQAQLLGALLLGSNAAMAALGLANHSGLAFWHRLTVHPDPVQLDADNAEQSVAAAAAAAAPSAAPSALWAWLVPESLLSAGAAAFQQSGVMAVGLALCLLPIACLAVLSIRMLGRRALAKQGPGLADQLQRWLVAAAFASVAAYHCLEQLVLAGMAGRGATASQLLQVLGWAGTGGHSTGQAVGASWQALMGMPLHLLLPRLTYTLCMASLTVWAAQQLQRWVLRCLVAHTAPLPAGAGKGGACASRSSAGLARMAEGAAGLQGPLLALLLQVSDSRAPLVLLLGAAELWAVAQLLALRKQCRGSGASRDTCMLEGAAIAAVVQAQMFFTTGHLCEFAGLQYLAGFVGFDEFHLLRSAALLVIHTFGAMLLVVLALPAFLSVLAGDDEQTEHSMQPKQLPEQATMPDGWRRAILVFLFVRSSTAFAAMLSAAVQRRHLYAWAIFAPKFAFEAVFLIGTDLLISFMCILMQ